MKAKAKGSGAEKRVKAILEKQGYGLVCDLQVISGACSEKMRTGYY